GPVKVPVETGVIGVPSPILGGSASRPDSICAPPDAQRANGRNCGIVVADITGGALNHIGAAVLWFQAGMTATATSGASNVDITLNGNHFGTLKSTDPIVCAANGQALAVEGADPAPSCHVDEAVRVFN